MGRAEGEQAAPLHPPPIGPQCRPRAAPSHRALTRDLPAKLSRRPLHLTGVGPAGLSRAWRARGPQLRHRLRRHDQLPDHGQADPHRLVRRVRLLVRHRVLIAPANQANRSTTRIPASKKGRPEPPSLGSRHRAGGDARKQAEYVTASAPQPNGRGTDRRTRASPALRPVADSASRACCGPPCVSSRRGRAPAGGGRAHVGF
jgi:hypothetical protein